MVTNMLFDDSIPRLVQAVTASLGDEVMQKGVILRDASGRLSFIVNRNANSKSERTKATKAMKDALGPYARHDCVLAFNDDPGASRLLADPSIVPFHVGNVVCRLIDRRIVGAGWLETPDETEKCPPRVVFASLKGGVGRSTALAVAAADFARQGKNVLVVDLDLEAPGVGDLLLDEERTPDFGVVDFLVENGIGGVPDSLLDGFVGVSHLTSGGGGRVHVTPALGLKAGTSPENVLPKLARAMIENVSDDGKPTSVSEQISSMIQRLADHTGCDVVLIDSRAGLAELAAPAVLALGATVLLFGNAQRQTVKGYRALFAGLKMLAERDRSVGREADWRRKLKAVHSKATFDEDVLAEHRDNLYDLFSEEIYDEDVGFDVSSTFSFDIDDVDAPHWPLLIPFNQDLVDFDPVRLPSQLTRVFYDRTFRPFLDGLAKVVEATKE